MLASRSIDVLVAILALCQVAVAFYPFTPDYRCIQDPKCDPSRKSHVASVEGRTTSLKLKQRVPKVSLTQHYLLTMLIQTVLGVARYPDPQPW